VVAQQGVEDCVHGRLISFGPHIDAVIHVGSSSPVTRLRRRKSYLSLGSRLSGRLIMSSPHSSSADTLPENAAVGGLELARDMTVRICPCRRSGPRGRRTPRFRSPTRGCTIAAPVPKEGSVARDDSLSQVGVGSTAVETRVGTFLRG